MNKPLGLALSLTLIAGLATAAAPDVPLDPFLAHQRPSAAPSGLRPSTPATLPGGLVRLPPADGRPLEPASGTPYGVSEASFASTASFPPTGDLTASVPAAYVEPPEPDAEYFTLDELKAEMKKLVWTKGDMKIVPYGSLWGSGIYTTERVFPGPYALFVTSASTEGEDEFAIDTRRTRLGLNVEGPRIPLFNCARSYGKVEIDFHGAFVVENKPGVLLRHAYGEVKDDYFRLLAGQTWDVISPLYPHTISYSVGWGGGNIGYRRAQVRLERYLHLSDVVLVTAQGSLNQNIISGFASADGVQPETTDWPVIEARLATTLGDRGPCGLPSTIGLSGHIGEQGADFVAPQVPQDDYRVRTWSLNVDVRVPLNDRSGFQGEFFTGENLGTFLGGVIQGVSIGTPAVPDRRAVRATGGWFEFWYDVTPRLHAFAGYGVDDPVDSDIDAGGRTYNHFIFANASFDVTDLLSVGMEVTSWKTLYNGLRPGEAVLFEFTGKYDF